MERDRSRTTMREAFEKQIAWCTGSSAFMVKLLTVLRDDLETGGETAAVLRAWPGDPFMDAVPLRLAGAYRFLALSGAAPRLAACYPPALVAVDRLRAEVLATAARNRDVIEQFLRSPPQTNEVGRSGILLGGFLIVAQRTGLPLRLLEIGASAGLNLQWDRYRYEIGGWPWGDPLSPVRLAPQWTGPLPPLDVTPVIASRAACDRAPVDIRDESQRLRLISYVWPDQTARLEHIRGAIDLCARVAQPVERAEAAPWVDRRLRQHALGTATVLFHSIMWQYMTKADQQRIRGSIRKAGAAADADAPLAWLRFEQACDEDLLELRLSLWPDELDVRLATAHAHGASVAWIGANGR